MSFTEYIVKLKGVESDFRWDDLEYVQERVQLPEDPQGEFHLEASHIKWGDQSDYKLLFRSEVRMPAQASAYFSTFHEMLGVIKNPETKKDLIREML